MRVPEVTVAELAHVLGMESAPVLIDVRESDELEISRFPAYTHIPMSEITSRLAEIDPGSDLVIVCRTGNRSARVTAYLLQAGYPRVRNLAGGINEWVRLVDPSQPVY